MSRSLWLVLAASLTLVGCDTATKEAAQYDDSRNPYYKQAQQDLDNNNPTAAVTDYEAALAANPKLAGAHYELGILYGDKLGDPIGSIFHFQQYLKLAPGSDKADQVKALVDKQSQAFAASLPNSPTQSADDYAKLQADNASLKKQLDDATHTIAQLQTQIGKHHSSATQMAAVPPPPAPTMAPVADGNPGAVAANPAPATPDGTNAPVSTNTASATPPRALPLDATNAAAGTPDATTADAGPSRTYKVVAGDSYWKIAKKMYPGDTKNGVEKIQEANKETVGKPLKIGQVLIIPQ